MSIAARTFSRSRRSMAALLYLAVPLSMALPMVTGAQVSSAAGVNPLPATAHALASITRYQVTITNSGGGRPGGTRPPGTPRPVPTGTPRRAPGGGRGFGFGAQAETLTVVKKGSLFEDYFVLKGKNQAGKTMVSEFIIYGTETCSKINGATKFTCQKATNQFLNDPTLAFAQGAGSSTVFTATSSKTVSGEVCAGYSYSFKMQNSSTTGIVYISQKTHLPCEQVSTVTQSFNGSTPFKRTSTIIWSNFNNAKLTVPAVPAA